MSILDEGGPAFPTYCDDTPGMSLRDYFAAAALPACLRKAAASEGPLTANDIAWEAYSLADAMLWARKQ